MIIDHILKNERLAPKDFEKLCIKMGLANKKSKAKVVPKITKRTLQRDLKDMIDKKILKVERATNQKSYYLKKGV